MFATLLGDLTERGGELQFVNPASTSQTCPECHVVDANSRQSQAVFVCTGLAMRTTPTPLARAT